MEKDLKGLRIDPERKGRLRRNGATNWILALVFLLAGAGAFALISGYLKPTADQSADKPAAAPAPESQAAESSSTTGEVLKASGYIVSHHKILIGSKFIGNVAWFVV
ncbi:MAG: hypothetical protein EHM61_11310 [Acidobacteria bacterium]|nr:MAG: hypothetical protein EHM61_11310 [Acidobacteriota bacterium]